MVECDFQVSHLARAGKVAANRSDVHVNQWGCDRSHAHGLKSTLGGTQNKGATASCQGINYEVEGYLVGGTSLCLCATYCEKKAHIQKAAVILIF